MKDSSAADLPLSGNVAHAPAEKHDHARQALLRTNEPILISSLYEAFAKSHAHSLNILELGGVHPFRPRSIPHPSTGELVSEDFCHIGEHSIAVALAASRICEHLRRRNILSIAESVQIIHRALIHDAAKGMEIIARSTIEELTASADEDSFKNMRALKERIREFEAQLDNPGTEAGHEHVQDFLVTHHSGLSGICTGKLAEKVVRLADDMTSTTVPDINAPSQSYFVTPSERIVISDFSSRYPKLYRQGLGLVRGLRGYKLTEVRDINRPTPNTVVLGNYVYLQTYVANEICKELKQLIAENDTRNPDVFIKDLILARV